LVAFTESLDFENFIIFCIFLNSLVLASYDYSDRDNEKPENQILEKIGLIFSYIFIVECVVKIMAMGFIVHKNSYLRDAWNIIDLIVVMSSLVEMFEIGTSGGSIKALRVLRVFRPLRSIKTLPSMRQLIESLLSSLPNLGSAVLFMVFVFLLFGILGVQLFSGRMHYRCRLTEEPLSDDTWPFDETFESLCNF
jgi:hypothetical protein